MQIGFAEDGAVPASAVVWGYHKTSVTYLYEDVQCDVL